MAQNTNRNQPQQPLDPKFNFKFLLKSAVEAVQWFKQQIQSLKTTFSKDEKEERDKEQAGILKPGTYKADTFEVGKMYLFHYDPKGRQELPYYDTFPLILLTDIHKGGFSGINLHYLPPEQRLILLSNLTQKSVYKNGKLDRLNIKYENLAGVQEFALFEPCYKRYLKNHIRSQIKLIPPEDWGFAASLPIEAFMKKPKQYVWRESLATQGMTL